MYVYTDIRIVVHYEYIAEENTALFHTASNNVRILCGAQVYRDSTNNSIASRITKSFLASFFLATNNQNRVYVWLQQAVTESLLGFNK